jgi:hypothetical protein
MVRWGHCAGIRSIPSRPVVKDQVAGVEVAAFGVARPRVYAVAAAVGPCYRLKVGSDRLDRLLLGPKVEISQLSIMGWNWPTSRSRE